MADHLSLNQTPINTPKIFLFIYFYLRKHLRVTPGLPVKKYKIHKLNILKKHEIIYQFANTRISIQYFYISYVV